MADLNQAVKLKPDDPHTLVQRGGLKLRNHDLAGAEADFDAASKADPSNTDWDWTIAEGYEYVGMYEQAIARYDAWFARNPKSDFTAGALNGRCWARAQWGKELDKALADCSASLRLKPRQANVLDSRGLVKLRLGDLEGAVADYSAALRLQPTLAWSHYGRGLAELKQGHAAQSRADLDAGAAIDPGLPAKAARLGLAP